MNYLRRFLRIKNATKLTENQSKNKTQDLINKIFVYCNLTHYYQICTNKKPIYIYIQYI